MASAQASSRRLRRRRGNRSSARRQRSVAGLRRRSAIYKKARYEEGFADGYREGVQTGMQSYPIGFEGTSIIIPTYNQLDMLKQCISSIVENTDLPYEIIVVDNASTDGTKAYLEKLGGQVRYRVLASNQGFAGAINVGMMMAKGSTILLLNNDTLVTPQWLDNMLACLHSDDRIGMVGPVTNFISGDQQIKVPYANVREMYAFARQYNQQDPARWRRTDRLVGFCLLFRKELFHQVGYFDEGFEIGNFEDDDYNIRVRMLGKSLVVAEDTFIHHYGSVSMRALGDRQALVHERNQLYFMDKWLNPYDWIHRIRHIANGTDGSAAQVDMTGLFPSGIAVRGIGSSVYWIDNGTRRLVEGLPTIPVVRLSQVDLLRWPISDPIGSWEIEALWHETEGPEGQPRGGVRLPDGTTFIIEQGKARKIVSPAALLSWQLHEKPYRTLQPEELAELEEGFPIIPHPMLRQVL
ncbi:glycosyltransferase family 2 protein [Cohnella lubricantis]|uniref:Glycosyltransferase family 2 protein n=1 Tax=Cohnella lubricantis TaxID=2163172 RepID=A0A841TJ12_9BACL|nr:glycosyltransferase family 2 protein [Cohnella lubricantis]MBB6678917.1 glycosyltransferase family 2 protein [Cohnella lubricantis]MBP2120357.1 GT2 family glycosyltransferase [Cohnella lubricantis]